MRLAAENEIGLSQFSQISIAYTSGCVPNVPVVPKLRSASVSTMCLEWETSTMLNEVEVMSSNDMNVYELQMLDMDDKVAALHGFLTVFNGQALSYEVGDLKRCCSYKFRVII